MNTKKDRTDRVTSLARGVLGMAPIVGPLLAELVSEVIPNQRVDRLEAFARALEEDVRSLATESVRSRFVSPGFVSLLEDGFVQAARAVTEERIRYLAALVGQGLRSEHLEIADLRKLMYLLGEVSDAEVIVLLSHGVGLDQRSELQDRHRDLLMPMPLTGVSPQAEIDRYAVRTSYTNHLVRLGLLKPHFFFERGLMPHFDPNTGMVKANGFEITDLGRALLRHLKLVDQEKANMIPDDQP